jgi:hypothetical protein
MRKRLKMLGLSVLVSVQPATIPVRVFGPRTRERSVFAVNVPAVAAFVMVVTPSITHTTTITHTDQPARTDYYGK